MKMRKILRWRKRQVSDHKSTSEIFAEKVVSILIKYDHFVVTKFNRFSIIHTICADFIKQRDKNCDFIIVED